MQPRIVVHLKRDREKPVRHGHPWIFSGAVERWEGSPGGPAVVEVVDAGGHWLARGIGHPGCNLAVRVMTREPGQLVDDYLLTRRLDDALELRAQQFGPVGLDGDTDSYRLFFAEADGISGLIIDRYADVLSVRVSAAGLLPFLPALLAHLNARTGIARWHVAAEREAVEREGVDPAAVAALSRGVTGAVRIRESGFQYEVDFASGQKTGFYLDQRENRRRTAAYARGRRVLSAYCYTGSFELHAAAAGALHITGLDSSADALKRAAAHHDLNGLHVPVDYREADVPEALRRFRDANRHFDLILLDPPRFVSNIAQKEKGMRAYKDINLLAIKLLEPDGILATFSCAGLVSPADLQMAVSWAAVDAGREVQILETLGQPADHPIRVAFPESAYLHGLIARVL
jgi:23S rRNA (cytosine1962-C5)-methyltransferase